MALSPAEQTQLKALITREGGLVAFNAEVAALAVAAQQAAAQTTLSPAISVTVQDWTAIGTYLATTSNLTMYSVMASIKTAAAAKDATQLGPLFVQLYAAVKAHLSL
jgi:hypothetical protein